MLIDSFGRKIVNLRISVTDRCNLRCSYCLPNENVEWLPSPDELAVQLFRMAIACTLLNVNAEIPHSEPFS